jgi:hypothetical protein
VTRSGSGQGRTEAFPTNTTRSLPSNPLAQHTDSHKTLSRLAPALDLDAGTVDGEFKAHTRLQPYLGTGKLESDDSYAV